MSGKEHDGTIYYSKLYFQFLKSKHQKKSKKSKYKIENKYWQYNCCKKP